MIIKFWLQMDDEITEVTHEHPGMVSLVEDGYSQVISDFASFLVATGWHPQTVDDAFESREPYVQEQSVRGVLRDDGPQWTEETDPE